MCSDLGERDFEGDERGSGNLTSARAVAVPSKNNFEF